MEGEFEVMVNAKAKGRRREQQTKRLLEERGWLVELVRGSYRFNKQVDFFGLFDIIAIKYNPIRKQTEVRLVQVKSNRRPDKETRKRLREFWHKYPDMTIEEWVFKDRKKLEIYSY